MLLTPLALSQTVTPSRTPSSVTDFMDGPLQWVSITKCISNGLRCLPALLQSIFGNSVALSRFWWVVRRFAPTLEMSSWHPMKQPPPGAVMHFQLLLHLKLTVLGD